MKRSLTLIIGLLVVIAAAAVASYLAGPNGLQGSSEARLDALPSLDSVLSEDTDRAGSSTDGTADLAGPAVQTASVPVDEPAAEDGFVFTRLEIKTGEEEPQACFVFSEPLAEADVRYSDFVRLGDGDTTAVVTATGPLLCMGGLAFGTDYTVTLREGLPALSGARLAYDETVPVSLSDRPAAVSFGSGIVLPRESANGVPITTVNVDKLKIRVMRVGDRLLSQLQSGLLDEKVLYRWGVEEIETEKGSVIWTGEMDVSGPRNRTMRTLFPISEVTDNTAAGAYLIIAEDAAEPDTDTARYGGKAAQWVVASDLGLTSFAGTDGLHVFARSLDSAEPLARVRLALVARNNEILATAETRTDGGVRFDPGLMRGTGGMTPVMVFAYDGYDFNFHDLRRAAFDLSDRGVSGRTDPGPVDAFVYLDRGIYRPGETVQIVSLLRDDAAQAIEDAPLTLIVRRPDGIEYRRQTIGQQQAGGVYLPVTLSKSAPRGRWTVSAYLDPERAPVGSASFGVQDFVPERIALSLSSAAATLRPGDAVSVDATARYLYDAPGANLGGEASLRLVPDAEPFKDFAAYDFGLVEERFSPTFTDLTIARTDAAGATVATGTLEDVPDTSKPLRAAVTVSVFEPGGRMTREQISIPVRTRDVMLGIDPAFDGGGVREGAEARFGVVAVDADGNQTAGRSVSWQIIREVVNYQWYEIDGRWQYERIVKDRPVDAGSIALDADNPANISAAGLDWGTYRFQVADDSSGAKSSVRFYVGWYGGNADGQPDRVTVIADKPLYRAGDTARITVRAPTAAKALVTIAGSEVFETRSLTIPAEGTTFSVDVDRAWGAGAYVMVTAYHPLKDARPGAPVRSIGLAHVTVDQSARTLSVDLEVPETVAPQQQIDIPLTVRRGEDGRTPESAFVTLAAVDTGILMLTDFEPPAPEDHYFGKRRLGIDMRDTYGRLIRDVSGAAGQIRSGGDGFGDAGGLNVVPTKTVALFSGVVALDGDGKAIVPLDIPDFVGELTLMAVAFSPQAVGHSAKPVTVRRAVVGDMFFPRFLAPGDSAEATLQINNVDGAAGAYTAVVRRSGALGTAETALEPVTLAPGSDTRMAVSLTGAEPGIGTIALDVTGPEDFALTRSWDIEVRAPRLPETTSRAAYLEPGTDLALDADLTGGFIDGTQTVTLSLGGVPGFDVPALLRSLDRYPYGCLEQTTSRAFPLLFFNEAATAAGLARDDGLKARIQDAVDRVLDLQTASGAFGMWSHAGGEANLWLSVFALDFLLTAKESGYVVPSDAVRRGTSWLQNLTATSWQDVTARAYAFHVLAKTGQARIAELRYLFDAERAEIDNAMGLALLGAALDEAGDRARARIAFREAVGKLLAQRPAAYNAKEYGSLLRDVAGVTALAAQSRRTDILPRLVERVREMRPALRATTTQEKAWMLLAAHRLRTASGTAGTMLSLNAEGIALPEAAETMVLSPDAEALDAGIAITNTGADPVWYAVAAEGVPLEGRAPEANGLVASKEIFTLDGKPADLSAARQSERYVVLIRGRMDDNTYREMAALDLLPGGFEIETVLPAGSHAGLYPFLPELTPTQMTSARDDRFVAAFTVGSRYQPRPRRGEEPKIIRPAFAMAYVVRAVTPGSFAVPAVRVEDMYAPRILARTAEGRLNVQAAN